MIAGLVILIIIIGVVLRLYLNGTILNSFVTLISVIVAMAIAMGYYETLANLMISKGFLIKWAFSISLLALFAISFVILRIIANFFVGTAINFSNVPDKIICCTLGAVYASIACGILLISLSMSPIPSKWTYSRYDKQDVDLDSPKGALIPADSITSSLFSTISAGSMKSSNSFPSVHPNFLNQIHLNNLNKDEGVLSFASEKALITKRDGSWWRPVETYINSSTGEPLDEPTIVRAAIKSGTIQTGGAANEDNQLKFTLSQFLLITTDKPVPQNKFDSTKTSPIHPIGYIITGNQVEVQENPTEIITVSRSNFTSNEGYGNSFIIDLVFDVPNNQQPIALTFKNNAIAELGKPASQEALPQNQTFVEISKCDSEQAQVADITGTKIKPLELTANDKLMVGLQLVMDMEALEQLGYKSTGPQTVLNEKNFICGKINFKAAPSFIKKPMTRANMSSLAGLLAKMPNYELIALNCQINTTSNNIEPSQFPVLLDLQGNKHYPVGVLAGGKMTDGNFFYQLDYCAIPDNLTIENQIVTESFVNDLWITKEVNQIEEMFFFYNVSAPESTRIILNVIVNDKRIGFKDCAGFLVDKKSINK